MKRTVARWILLLLIVATGLFATMYRWMLSGVGIAVHDAIYMAIPDRGDVWPKLSDKIFAIVMQVILIPFVLLGVWIILTTALILSLTGKKTIKSIGMGTLLAEPPPHH